MRVDLRSIAEAAHFDPKQALIERVGPLEGYDVFHNYVLAATFIPPDKTQSGIILTDRSLAESRFQGKAFLVLKVGPLAFKDDDVARFGGMTVAPGDWIMFRPSDALECFVQDQKGRVGYGGDGISVRLIADTLIYMRIPDPMLIY